MTQKLYFLPLLCLISLHVSGQNNTYVANYPDVFGRFAKIGMANDVNPVLQQESNDFGHTIGALLSYRYAVPETNTLYQFTLESDLYTENVDDSYYFNDENRKIYPQYFTEISNVTISVDRYLSDKNFFIGLKSYFGVYNKEKPIPGLVLYWQGGMDGEGGYHEFMGNNPGLENISTGGQQFLFYIEPSLKKYFIGRVVSKNDNAFLKLHAGVKLGYPFKGIKVFANANAELPLVQINANKTNLFKLTLLYNHELSLHRDGVLYMPDVGAEVSFLFLSVGYTSNFYLGNRNTSMMHYIDDESMMFAYLKIKLFDMF